MGKIYHWRYKLYICKVSSLMNLGKFFLLPITHHTQSSDYSSTIELMCLITVNHDKSTHHLWIKVNVLHTWQMSSLPGTCQSWHISPSHLPVMTMAWSGGYTYADVISVSPTHMTLVWCNVTWTASMPMEVVMFSKFIFGKMSFNTKVK